MLFKRLARLVVCTLVLASTLTHAQTTEITTEYLMTLYAPLDPPQQVDSSLSIYNLRAGGWVKGPRINGTLVAPGADWLRAMPSGSLRLDVRGTIRTDDGALVYIAYNGVLSMSQQAFARLLNGEVLTSEDLYFITAPTMQTSSEAYAWLNHVQCVGKVVEVKAGEDAFVTYDVYVVR